MNKWIYPLTMTVALLSPTSHANDGSNLYSSGADSCGKWTRQSNSDDPNLKPAVWVMRAWIYGYISGVDAYISQEEPFYIKNTDTQAITQWMDSYCEENPLKIIADAADKLLLELVVHKK